MLLFPASHTFKVFGLNKSIWMLVVVYVLLSTSLVSAYSIPITIFLLVLTGYFSIAFMLISNKEINTLQSYLTGSKPDALKNINYQFNAGLAEITPSLLTSIRNERRHKEFHQDTVSEISHTASELSATAKNLASNIQQQSLSTDTIAAAVNEISYSINEMSERITSAHKSATESFQQGQDGAATMKDVRTNMEEVANYTDRTYQLLSSLDELTIKVSSMSDIITSIAEQTNLLALNAAIEAARAGEYGRGFAVVADEVRALASRSHNSAKEITTNINEVQLQMNAVKDSMDNVVTRAEQTVVKANDAEQLLNKIVKNTESVSSMISEVSEASKQQNEAAHEIAEKIEEVARVAGENSDMATQSSVIADHLYRLSQKEDDL